MSDNTVYTAADRRRALALSRKSKLAARVPASTLLARIARLLNDENIVELAVSDVYPNSKPSVVVARFRTVIIDSKLDELVYPVHDDTDGLVYIVKLNAPVADEGDEGDDDDELTSENDN